MKASSALKKPGPLKKTGGLQASSALKKSAAAKASAALRESAAAQDLRGLATYLFHLKHNQLAHYTRRVLIRGEIDHLTLEAVETRQQSNTEASNRLMTQIIGKIGEHGVHLGVSKPSQRSNRVEIKGRTKTGKMLLQIFHEEAGKYQQKPSTIRF